MANVYFIMPMPGSQEIKSLGFAYSLYSYRFMIRLLLGFLMLLGIRAAWKLSPIPVSLLLISLATVLYMTNIKMTADHMFYQPSTLVMRPASENKVELQKLVIGVSDEHESKAYPIQFIGFHHQV